MKNVKKILLILLLVLSAGTVFVGCTNNTPVQLATPVASTVVNSGHLVVMTTDNPNAESYVFGIYSGPSSTNLSLYYEQSSSNNYLDVTSYATNSSIYYFYVRAIGNGEKYLDSGNSSVISYDNTDALASPLLELTGTTLSWTGIANSNGYKIYKNNVYLSTIDETIYNIAGQINSPVVYNFEVQAIGSTAGGITYKDSLKSNVVSYTAHLTLSVPENLRVLEDEITHEDYLTWDEVDSASGYTVLIDNTTEVIVSTNSLILTNAAPLAKQYDFQVKANASGVLIASAYSDNYYYEHYVTLGTPVISGARRNGTDVIVEWAQIENAQSYTLIVNGEVLRDISNNVIVIYDTEVLIGGNLEKPEGGFDFQVYANGYSYYSQSETSELFNYGGVDELTSPENISVVYNESAGTVTVSWDEILGSSYYLVAIDQETYTAEQLSIEIQGMLEVGQVAQVRVQAKGEGFVIDSPFSETVMFNYTSTNLTNYTNRYFYYYGYYDYYITSQEELNALFGYAISHFEEDFTACIDYNLTIEQQEEADANNDEILTEQEIINHKQHLALLSYTETHSLSYESPHDRTNVGYVGNVAYTFSIGFSYDMDPSLLSNDPEVYIQSADYIPYQSATSRDSEYNDFAPEQSLIEVEVKNSENLFMVVNSGAKPIFIAENSQAEQVYEAAKTILRQIVNNDMTDYEKMLAIFDYVNYNTIYDRYIYNLAMGGGNTTLPEYRVFYLEGVLIDHTAVCDGISKAIAFLASMEGIEAVKINGTAGTINNTVGHAWNKVYLEVDGESNWFMIDATWGISSGIGEIYTDSNENDQYDLAEEFIDENSNDVYDYAEEFIDANANLVYDEGETFTDANSNSVYDYAEIFTDANENGIYDVAEPYTDENENGKYDFGEEYLTHDYFLIQDIDIADSHFATSPFNPVADTYFDYYNSQEYAPGYDYYIDDQTSLNHMVEYLLLNNAEGVEIYVESSFSSSFANKVQLAINVSGVSGVTCSVFTYTSPISDRTITMIDFIYE